MKNLSEGQRSNDARDNGNNFRDCQEIEGAIIQING